VCAVLTAALVGPPVPAAAAPTTAPTAAPTAAPTDGLSSRQLAGQRAVYSYAGLTPPTELFDLIRRGEAAGVIFFGENITDKDQIRGVIDQLQTANRASPVKAPLLMMTDQEGGEIRRIPGAPALSEKQIGDAAHPRRAAIREGTAGARNVEGAGINVNLAPVLGVYREPNDFLDQFQRSYSKDPDVVARLGRASIEAQQRVGIATTAKHFPGLGAAGPDDDTDVMPVTIDLPAKTLRDVDERPYPPAIAAGVDLVMVSWATYPALDPARPAGLSRPIVEGRLRDRLGFEGVTVTDALEAGALTRFGTVPEIGILAAEAGMDLLLYSDKDIFEGLGGLEGLVAALDRGRLDRSEYEAAAARVLALRERLGKQRG
jgi:beta-N-acetylhexosaminidase